MLFFVFSYNIINPNDTMTIDFYYMSLSPPCRVVQMAAEALGVDLNLKLTNLVTGDHLTPEFIKVNYFVGNFIGTL